MVAGRAGVFENSASIGRDPNETEDGSVESRGGGAKVVKREVGFINLCNRGQMKRKVGSIADSDDGLRVESGYSDEIVMGRWRVLSRAEGANIYDGALKLAS